MKTLAFTKRVVLSIYCALALPLSACAADDPAAGKYTDPATGYIYALDPAGPLPDALRPAPPTKKKGPLKKVMSAAGKELGTSFEDMGKDLVLIFSVQDIDPYEKHPDGKHPYELLQIRMIDGSDASLIKYPDGSLKLQGGFADGTVAVPTNPRTLSVLYPNGAKGRLEKLPGGGAKVYRPDNTVTTMAKNASGSFSISNDKLGYMGSATPDQTGLRYEMATGSY